MPLGSSIRPIGLDRLTTVIGSAETDRDPDDLSPKYDLASRMLGAVKRLMRFLIYFALHGILNREN